MTSKYTVHALVEVVLDVIATNERNADFKARLLIDDGIKEADGKVNRIQIKSIEPLNEDADA